VPDAAQRLHLRAELAVAQPPAAVVVAVGGAAAVFGCLLFTATSSPLLSSILYTVPEPPWPTMFLSISASRISCWSKVSLWKLVTSYDALVRRIAEDIVITHVEMSEF
jgi:hypothetical protein